MEFLLGLRVGAKDKDGRITLPDFQGFVGRMGGGRRSCGMHSVEGDLDIGKACPFFPFIREVCNSCSSTGGCEYPQAARISQSSTV